MWTLIEALLLIRKIQPEIHAMKYHVCLAGGVLNNGQSDKDVDLVFLPITNEEIPELSDLCGWFDKTWGMAQDNCTDPDPAKSLRYQASYIHNDKRIDVFVV